MESAPKEPARVEGGGGLSRNPGQDQPGRHRPRLDADPSIFTCMPAKAAASAATTDAAWPKGNDTERNGLRSLV
jgi:hypothetical protein